MKSVGSHVEVLDRPARASSRRYSCSKSVPDSVYAVDDLLCKRPILGMYAL